MTRRIEPTNLADAECSVLHAQRSARYLAGHRLTVDEIRWVLVEEFQLSGHAAGEMAYDAIAATPHVLGPGQSTAAVAPNRRHVAAPIRPGRSSPGIAPIHARRGRPSAHRNGRH